MKENIKYSPQRGLKRLLKDYLDQNTKTKQLVVNYPSPDTLVSKAKERINNYNKRSTLCDAIEEQYHSSKLELPELLNYLREDNSVTITTGHQLSLYGGAKYFIHKIISVIQSCEVLNSNQSDHIFIPVFWLASEDHDYEEVNIFRAFGQSICSDKDYTGAVGRADSNIFHATFESFKSLIGTSKSASEIISAFQTAGKADNLADYTRIWVSTLFENKILIVDGDDKQLKKIFAPYIEQELFSNSFSENVLNTNHYLETNKYHVQVNPRTINLFYLTGNSRERIEKRGDTFFTVNNTKKWSADEIKKEVNTHPENFSPNAIFRPVYQELILPNVAYIGGPGEIAYWLQLKSGFEKLTVSFPLLILRDSFVWVAKKDYQLINNLQIEFGDLSLERESLLMKIIRSEKQSNLNLSKYDNAIDDIFDELKEQVSNATKGYDQMVEAERKHVNNFLHKLEKKLVKAKKDQDLTTRKKVTYLQEKYFPNGILNERSQSFVEDAILNRDTKKYLSTLKKYSDIYNSDNKLILID